MADHRPGPDRDRILVAQLTGTARHHAKWRELTGDEEAAAVSELRELAGGRTDLLAEVAGILEGASGGGPQRADRPAVRLAVPPGRSRPGGHPGLDRGRPPPEGDRE